MKLERLHKSLINEMTNYKICGQELNRNESTSRLEGTNGVG